MDFGIDTIVYIILGVVFLVAQASKKKRPQVPGRTADSDEVDPTENRPIPSLLEEFLGRAEVETVVEKPVEKKLIFPNESPLLSSASLPVNELLFDNLSEKMTEGLHSDQSGVKNEAVQKAPSALTDFDLRKAVIYSAVLERKYF